jgi:hypothetical protein
VGKGRVGRGRGAVQSEITRELLAGLGDLSPVSPPPRGINRASGLNVLHPLNPGKHFLLPPLGGLGVLHQPGVHPQRSGPDARGLDRSSRRGTGTPSIRASPTSKTALTAHRTTASSPAIGGGAASQPSRMRQHEAHIHCWGLFSSSTSSASGTISPRGRPHSVFVRQAGADRSDTDRRACGAAASWPGWARSAR